MLVFISLDGAQWGHLTTRQNSTTMNTESRLSIDSRQTGGANDFLDDPVAIEHIESLKERDDELGAIARIALAVANSREPDPKDCKTVGIVVPGINPE